MRQPSWMGWASLRSNLPRWAGVPLLVAVVIMASLGWVILARGTSPADGGHDDDRLDEGVDRHQV